MSKPCAWCKAGHVRRSRFCSKKCGQADYRSRNRERINKAVSAANRRRYATDPNFRAAHYNQKRSWAARKKAVIGTTSRSDGFRSQMEERLAPGLLAAGASYEPLRFTYPTRRRGYTPDFILPNAIVLEVKGWFEAKDRAKMIAVKQEHPNLDIRMILASPRQFITQNKTMTQSGWCEKHGFPWAEKTVPPAWLTEPTRYSAQLALSQGVAVKKKVRAVA